LEGYTIFESWSDQGAQTHDIVISTENITIQANFVQDLNIPNGVNLRYYEGNWTSLPTFESLSPQGESTVPNFDISAQNSIGQNFAVEFSGYINIITAGDYTFFTSSQDGSRLYIDDQVVVDNDNVHEVIDQSGTINLVEGAHPIRVTYFKSTEPGSLIVGYEGPDLPKQVIPSSVLFVANPTACKPQTINFSAIPDKTVSDTPFTNSASSDSNLQVSYDLESGPATVSPDGTITLLGQPGTVTVVANQAGNFIYCAAQPVVVSFNVA